MNLAFYIPVLQYKRSKADSEKKEILKQLTQTMQHRVHLDQSIELIGMLLLGPENGPPLLNAVRPRGLPVVDDWECLKSMVRNSHCRLFPPLLS